MDFNCDDFGRAIGFQHIFHYCYNLGVGFGAYME